MPSVRGERENDIGITWYPPLGTHIALPEERAVLLGFTSGEDLVGSELLPTCINTSAVQNNIAIKTGHSCTQ